MAEFITNTHDLARARAALMHSFGMSLDTKRPNAYAQYGYPDNLTFADFRLAYERGGVGHGAVHKLLSRCWQKKPRIKSPDADEVSPWEKKVSEVLTAIGAWQKLIGFDRRNLIGHFSALIYRVGDGGKLNEPMAKASRLVNLVPLFEDQIRVKSWNDDPNSEDYGKPTAYEFRTRSPSSTSETQARPEQWAEVHPSRVQILAEGAEGDDFFEGVPLLKAGFNALVDIEKLSGAGAEGAAKNSARTIKIEYEPGSSPEVITTNPDGTPGTKSVREVHEEQGRKLNSNLDSTIVLQGGKADTLQTQVADLGPQFNISSNIFSASVGMPFTVLFGQQTGRLASDEDQKEMNARAGSRRDDTLTPMLTEFVKRMQACGIFEEGAFEIEWSDLGELTDVQKLDNAGKMATTNKTAFDGGSTDPIFNADEIRKAAGYEKRESGGDEFKEDDPEPLPGDPNAKKPPPAAK